MFCLDPHQLIATLFFKVSLSFLLLLNVLLRCQGSLEDNKGSWRLDFWLFVDEKNTSFGSLSLLDSNQQSDRGLCANELTGGLTQTVNVDELLSSPSQRAADRRRTTVRYVSVSRILSKRSSISVSIRLLFHLSVWQRARTG